MAQKKSESSHLPELKRNNVAALLKKMTFLKRGIFFFHAETHVEYEI